MAKSLKDLVEPGELLVFDDAMMERMERSLREGYVIESSIFGTITVPGISEEEIQVINDFAHNLVA